MNSLFRFIYDNFKEIVNLGDNIHRTCFHYACIINDKESIEILQQSNVDQVNSLSTFF